MRCFSCAASCCACCSSRTSSRSAVDPPWVFVPMLLMDTPVLGRGMGRFPDDLSPCCCCESGCCCCESNCAVALHTEKMENRKNFIRKAFRTYLSLVAIGTHKNENTWMLPV